MEEESMSGQTEAKPATPAIQLPVELAGSKVKLVKKPVAKKAAVKEPKAKAPKAKKEPKMKAAPKEVKTVKAKPVPGNKLKFGSRKPGPAMGLFKLKDPAEPGVCRVYGCSKKASSGKGRWCAPHKKEIRKAQLKANNVIWRKRVKAGTAGHHVVYSVEKKLRPTEWAVKNKEKALAKVKKGEATIEGIGEFKKLLSKGAHGTAASAQV